MSLIMTFKTWNVKFPTLNHLDVKGVPILQIFRNTLSKMSVDEIRERFVSAQVVDHTTHFGLVPWVFYHGFTKMSAGFKKVFTLESKRWSNQQNKGTFL